MGFERAGRCGAAKRRIEDDDEDEDDWGEGHLFKSSIVSWSSSILNGGW
jgi:hypothetical protein